MAVAKVQAVRQLPFSWEGTDKNGRKIRGEMIAPGDAYVRQNLRKQGINVTKVAKKGGLVRSRAITEKDIAIFTRQLATMLKSGVPLLQSFEIAMRSHTNPALQRLLGEVRMDVETGTSMSTAFRRHPQYFDGLYCNLVSAGEQAGILDSVLAYSFEDAVGAGKE